MFLNIKVTVAYATLPKAGVIIAYANRLILYNQKKPIMI
jgi:multidrug transporter EmrE-like cation transporter